jgi:L-ascorbate metabolism protein UlaG (beta-lactamase superfamily)
VAWAHVIPPVAGSLHLYRYQSDLLRSYLEDPRAHFIACQNPRMRSGPFVDVAVERAGEIERLLADTEIKLGGNLEFARGVIEFHNYLVKEAQGQSLDGFYDLLPARLRGFVELVYDYYNRPIMRFFESLLYRTPYYTEDLQSLRIFRQKTDDSRAFIMSTPRLAQPDQIDWSIAFDKPEVDEFFRLDARPRPLGYIHELLGLDSSQEHLLLPLLSSEPPRPGEASDHATACIRYIGHACVLIQANGISILTDPYIGITPSTGSKLKRLPYDELPDKIDYVLITHNHHDHFCLESLLRIRHRIGTLVVPRTSGFFYGDVSLKLLCQRIGFKEVIEVDVLDSLAFPGGEIIAMPFVGEHADLPHGKTAYVIAIGGERVMIAADSDCLDRVMYEHIRDMIGPIQTVFIGLECVGAPLSWSCGPFFPAKPAAAHEQTRHYKGCDSARALGILESVGASRLYIYAMGLEPWLEHLLGLAYSEDALQLREARRLLSEARERGLQDARLLYGYCELPLLQRHERQPVAYVETAPAVSGSDQPEDQFSF